MIFRKDNKYTMSEKDLTQSFNDTKNIKNSGKYLRMPQTLLLIMPFTMCKKESNEGVVQGRKTFS